MTHSLNYGGFMLEKIKNLIEQPIKEKGYLLDEITYEKESGTYFLRIVIDKENGYININDCVVVNQLLGDMLETVKELEENYILDICSKEKGDK